jgi:hypothetical protein
MAAANSARPATAPMTIPAMAPPESPELFSFSSAAEEDAVADTPVPDADDTVDAKTEFGVAEAAAFDDVLDAAAEVAELAALGMLEESVPPPITCARLTTPTLLVQQVVLSPQHHLSLSARPRLHGVIRATPKGPLT